MSNVNTNLRQLSEATDEALLVRVARRERQALERLYDRYSGRVCGLARQVQPNPDRAEQIVIETFWYVWKHADQMRDSAANVETWLMTIASWMASTPRDATPARNESRTHRNPPPKPREQQSELDFSLLQ